MADEVHEATKFLKAPKSKRNEGEQLADTQCGLFKRPRMQSWATEYMFAVVFGIAGCFVAMAFTYFNGTITTLEKRYRIPSQTTSIIIVGTDISTTLTSGFLGYYAGRGHRPRYIALGLVVMAVFCVLTASPHIIYGPGEDALKLTREYVQADQLNATDDTLCQAQKSSCGQEAYLWAPIVLLFSGQFISGIGCALFYTLGISYMDDNSSKSKTPAMLSWSVFLRMLGPTFGLSLASVCLRFYIDPQLEPLITNEDTRWLGAWWLGWIPLTIIMLLSAFFLYIFPKELPSARARRLKSSGHESGGNSLTELSLSDLLQAVKRLAKNKIYIYNSIASILYVFGYMPYWMFTPKYIETQYQQSASTATMATGSVALAFSAAGVLLSGYVISKYRPSARAMAAWNGIVDIFTVLGLLSYVLIGCDDSDKATSMFPSSGGDDSCTASCHCEYVHYAPICSPHNVTYISACHAGCTEKTKDELGQFLYKGCKCIGASDIANATEHQFARQGPCPADCYNQFLIFLGVMCLLKFVGSSGRTSNLLLGLRCVSSADKSLALGLSNMIVAVLAFIPSPLVFGAILDNNCLVWGKTCGRNGNCWLYDTKSLRYTMNFLSASCIFASSFWNIGVWYHAKNLKIFEEEDEEASHKEPEQFELSQKSCEIKTNSL
ncbi:solute carrier organic anion transporter family member 74D-like [Drosophila novamexicana]|uniref:solute carrier organic anion transporter family member 74D-like n=1 Tax=Drosophila novamexicana TaxID=47314 RepID=UPI0011E59AB9|nr:solute carrier organic anion transporter family member 74D-like [Drosophila novamexicana]